MVGISLVQGIWSYFKSKHYPGGSINSQGNTIEIELLRRTFLIAEGQNGIEISVSTKDSPQLREIVAGLEGKVPGSISFNKDRITYKPTEKETPEEIYTEVIKKGVLSYYYSSLKAPAAQQS